MFNVGDRVRQIETGLCFTVEAVSGNRMENCVIWSSELSEAYYEDGGGGGEMVMNWHNPDPKFMELAEPIPLSYKPLRHIMT